MMNIGAGVTLAVYTASHFVVDFGCGWLLYELYSVSTESAVASGAVFLIYNMLAFGLQFLIGALADRGGHRVVAACGCGLLCAGLLIYPLSGLAAVILAGLGNAAFHVGGGIDSLLFADGKTSRCGVFVSSGAVGVALGMLTGGGGLITGIVPVAACGICLVLILLFGLPSVAPRYPADVQRESATALTPPVAATALCLFAVLVRSYAGFLFSMPWKQGFALVLTAAVFAALGKASGGFLADALGGRLVGTLSVLAAIPLTVLGGKYIIQSLLGIMLFNMAMPITLYTAAERLRAHEGFAFGLTTLALLAGYLMFSYVTLDSFAGAVVLSVLSLLAGAALFLSVPGRNRGGDCK